MSLKNRISRILQENRARYAGILILIYLGSFAFVAYTSMANNLERLVNGFAKANKQEDLYFTASEPIEDIDAIESESGAIVDSYLSADVPLQNGSTLRLLSPCKRVDIPAVKEGSNLGNPGDILLDPAFLKSGGYTIGGSIEINGKAFHIAGTVALPHYIYLLKNINDILPAPGFGIGVIAQSDFSAFLEAERIYAVRFTERGDINAQAVHLRSLLHEKGYTLSEWVDAMNNKRMRMPWASISGVKTMSIPVPSAMFLLCCLIVGLTIRRMARADSVVIGTLYALGYRRIELIRHYMTIPLLLSVMGGVVGVLLALPLIRPAISFMVTYYNVPMTGVSVSPVSAAIGVLLPALFIGAASWLVLRAELKKPAVELMKGKETVRVSQAERALRLSLLPFAARFRIRSQLRSIPRLLFLLFGVAGASVLMLAGFTIVNSMNVLFNTGAGDMYRFRYEYSFKQVRRGEVPEGAEPFNAIRCYPQGREAAEFYLTGIEPSSSGIVLTGRDGTALDKNEVIITKPLADRLKLRPGDTLRLVDKLSGAAYSLVIDNVAETYGGQFVYMPLEAFNSMTGQAPGSYTGLFSMRELTVDSRALAGVKDMQNLSGAMNTLALPLLAAVVLFAGIAMVIGAVILFLVTSLLIEENRTTISLFKVFGYRGKEVGSLVLNGALPVIVIGFLLGIPAMLIMTNALYGYMGEMINVVLPMIIKPLHVVICFVLTLFVFELSKRLSAKKLNAIPMSDALKAGTE